MDVYFYDELIFPLVCRMINLKELTLDIIVDRYRRFIDGNDLKNVRNHVPQLIKFIFNIQSMISLEDDIHYSSNEEIQQTFIDFIDNKIISCVDYFPKKKIGQCHIYSYPYPYTMKHYKNITNNFPSEFFIYVREVSLFDERPFEDDFFVRIAKSFPLMKKLSLTNRKPQKHKEYE
jgi:hypothetical protein